MADPKDTTSFFRKVVKFVANPATEWAELDTPPEELRENEYAKGELKAMIERKRRNDFVRKREFDMLRSVRREGLTGDQLAALAGSSRLDDSEPRMVDSEARQQSGVKAKIDEIEQQMVGDNNYSHSLRRSTEPHAGSTATTPLDTRQTRLRAVPPQGGRVAEIETAASTRTAPLPSAGTASGAAPASPALHTVSDFNATPPAPRPNAEVTHDPVLDEAVIAFANADFDQCEHSLLALTGPGGARAEHPHTWLVLFDLYRAIGQQHKFESLALDYAQQFGSSAPQWFSMPRLVAEAVSEERRSSSTVDGKVGWVCPAQLDADGVASLAARALQMPLPWVFDWAALEQIDVEASARLSELFRSWIPQDLDMRWLNGERLFSVVQEAAPNGARDADPAYWQLRLDALRMTNRPDRFEEAAIDYCVTYEVSPPSWERARCEVRISGSDSNTMQPPLSVVSEASTSFGDSVSSDEPPGLVQVDSVELSGQLVGDIGLTLSKVDAEVGTAPIINVSCARLIRVDFIAAGDLLNWVLARRNENRTVNFVDAHRMVALFFGAMGINEHATVKVRTV
ncbi:MAG: hypothetical protein ABIV63_07325 [Caldimonas sp.]